MDLNEKEMIAKFANEISRFVNSFDTERNAELTYQLERVHPTLQQNFMRFIVTYLQKTAEIPLSSIDDRNRASVTFAKWVRDKLNEAHDNGEWPDYLPHI